MRHIQKRVYALITAMTVLLSTCSVSAAAAESSESQQPIPREENSLGASAACEGHALDTFSGVPACVNENGELHICENNFPDEIFREFVLGLTGTDDGYFSAQECGNISQIDVSYSPIESLRGVEFFTSLVNLNCSNSGLKELNCSRNVALTQLNCSGCGLTELDCSMNTALTELNCSKNLLKELNISNNPSLEEIDCSYNDLTNLDVASCINLSVFYCSRNQLTELDVSNNKMLTIFECHSNQITTLDFSENSSLTNLTCSSNPLTAINISNNAALVSLVCDENRLTELDVSGNPLLERLDCSSNQLKNLDISRNTALTFVQCSNNQLEKLDVSNSPNLTILRCDYNQLTRLDLLNNMWINRLDCSNNHITELFTNSYDGNIYELQVSPQTVTLPVVQSGDVWTADLSLLMSMDGLSRVDSVSQGRINLNTGIVTFTEKPESITLDCYIGKVYETMQVEVYLLEEKPSYQATINGESFAYATGQEIPLSAVPAYTERGWGYRFAGWSGDTDVIADANSSTTTITMPERDIVIDAEYLLVGDANQDGQLTLEDALYISQMAVGTRTELSEGDIDNDGLISVLDITYMRWYLVGNYIPTK